MGRLARPSSLYDEGVGTLHRMGDTGGAGARVNIVSDMVAGRREPARDGAVRAPEPTTRPSHHAQWDEVRVCWTEWDQAAGAWVPIGDGPAASDSAAPERD